MFDPSELQAAVNAPEVHAAVLRIAKEVVLSPTANLSKMPTNDLAEIIAMNAAMILRSYLEFLGRRELPTSADPFDA